MILIPTHRIIDRASLRARARSRARLPKNFHPPPSPTIRPPRGARHPIAHLGRSPRARANRGRRADFDRFARASGVTRARPLARDASRAPLAPIVARSRSPRARDVPARRRERSRARAHLKSNPRAARGQGMKRSRDDGPGAGAAIKRCERDATRRRCDRASTRRRDARARDATTTRDAGFATRSAPSFRAAFDGTTGDRPTTEGVARDARTTTTRAVMRAR